MKLLVSRSDVLVMVSDHGFSKFSYAISINDILFKHGMAKIKYSKNITDTLKTKASITITRLVENIPFLARALRIIYKHARDAAKIQINYGKVDYKESIAFMIDAKSYGIYLNEKDVIEKVIKTLGQYEGIKWVKTPKEVYKGPYISRAPDLLVMPDFDKGYKLAPAKIHGAKYIAVDDYGHHPEGVLSVYCPDFTLSTTESKVPAWIVAPLILSILNIPLSHVTDDVDILEKITGTSITKKNYVAKWKIIRNMYKIKRI